MSFRIKMYCTAPDELLFNNNKINKKVGNDIITSMMPNSNMKEIFILHKNKKRFYIKSIEFSSDVGMTEIEFISFIKHMQQAGFYSKRDSNIKFIDKNVTVYNYSFQTIQKQHVEKRQYKRNTSTYRHLTIYKKNSKGIICD
jgi:hypothetical protein